MMIETIYGPMEEKLLLKGKRTGGFDNDNETTEWVEYWIEGVMVHRSVSTKLKKGLFAFGQAAEMK
jgi:hypothetical protein